MWVRFTPQNFLLYGYPEAIWSCYLNQEPLQWWQESSSLLSSKDWGFSGYHNKWPPIEPNKLFLLHKRPSAFVPLPSINEALNNIFSWKHRILEFDLRQIIPCLIFSWIQVKMFNCRYNLKGRGRKKWETDHGLLFQFFKLSYCFLTIWLTSTVQGQ